MGGVAPAAVPGGAEAPVPQGRELGILDELYKADALDVDSDIRVMETMLERDTASVEKDFGLGGMAAEEKPKQAE